MKLRLVPAAQGFAWVRQGLQALRKQPLGFIGLVGMMVGAALLLLGLPMIGPIITVALMPMAWMGFALATRRVVLGERVTPGVMIEAVRSPGSPRRAFAQLGLAYVAATFVAMLLAEALGPGGEVLREAVQQAQEGNGSLLDHPLIWEDMAWRVGLTLPVSLLFWHAPALVLWARLPVGKALFFSAVASWRNLGAFAVYGLGWLGVLGAAAAFNELVVAVLPVPALSAMVSFAVVLATVAAFYASLYFSVVDCFESPKAQGPQGAASEDRAPAHDPD